MSAQGWLYIPIETKVRELQGKLLLAAVAAEAGLRTIVGHKDEVFSIARKGPRGHIFNFGLSRNFAAMSRRYRQLGHKVVSIDEEGLVTLRDELYVRYRVSPETLRELEMFFCWGEKQAALVREQAADAGCKVLVTGNPRFDMFRPEFRSLMKSEVESIRNKYGSYILVNTNFGSSNHVQGKSYSLSQLTKKGWMGTPEDESYHCGRIGFQETIIQHFKTTLPILGRKFPDLNVIVRPHPSESHALWREAAALCENVHVVHEGTVTPWIMGAEAIIHNGCTTAIEAFLLGIPAIAYRPLKDNKYETRLPNELSVQAGDVGELVEAVRHLRQPGACPEAEAGRELLARYLQGVEGALASDRIVAHLLSASSGFRYSAWRSNVNWLRLVAENVRIKRWIKQLLGRGMAAQEYIRCKFPGLEFCEVESLLKSFSKATGRFNHVRAIRLGKNTYCIDRFK